MKRPRRGGGWAAIKYTLRMAWPADQDATCKQLETAGVPVQGTRGHRNEVGFSIFVNDPIGNRLELSFDPPDHGYPLVYRRPDGSYAPDPVQQQAIDVFMGYFDRRLKK